MDKFTQVKSIPAYLPIVNVDTDMIIPKQFLKTIKRTGLGKSLFFELRYDEQGNPLKEFVLNQEPYNQSKVLIGEKNFGCGSSREHAPWSLLDFGIKVVIAPSFADIFYNNCFKNGILPIVLKDEEIKELAELSKEKKEITINLEEQKIEKGDNRPFDFDVEPFRKECLMNGYDDIALSLKKTSDVENYIEKQKKATPWLFSA
ncbi:MAG: 3-isopropylmalate dehydratase small subunit [Pelagibacteraceae bacterium]|jgi:3-isopropylmalate/(R)-2-methylmalate dehydratase small subunit|uniref:3-isopropylmalate dehydratase small subunit n=1 Tax=Candidatus Pelagibacter sp. HIMB109 TaxID=3415412 RepID=UPI0031263EE1|tara:strand:+ start:238 stop:846 length:609 start_codon:yes stop_codon:yes gene_type:complete